MDDLLVALAGGAVGALLAALAWAGLRIAAIPGDIQRHDFEARVINQDLEAWVGDTFRALRQELEEISNGMAARGLLQSGIHGSARAEAKSRALHQWRDRLNQALRDFATINSRETWAHGLWRKQSGKTETLEIWAIVHAEPVIDEIRRPVTRHGSPPVPVHDPTRFGLDDLQRMVDESPLEPALPDEG